MNILRWSLVLVVLSLFAAALPAQDLELDGTYEDEWIIFDYPTDWFFCDCPREEPVVIMGTAQSVVKAMAPQKDEMQVIIVKSVADFLQYSGSAQDISTLDAKGIVQMFNRDSPLGIKPIPDTDGFYRLDEGTVDSLILVMPMEDEVFGMMMAIALPGDLDPFVDTLLEMGSSMHLPEAPEIELPTELDESYRKNGVRFDYPEGWITREDDEFIMIFNDERILGVNSFGALRDGQYVIFLFPTLDSLSSGFGYPEEIGGDAALVAEFLSMIRIKTYETIGILTSTDVDERAVISSLLTGEDHDWMFLTVDSEDGDDVITLMAYGEIGTLEELHDLMAEMITTVEAR